MKTTGKEPLESAQVSLEYAAALCTQLIRQQNFDPEAWRQVSPAVSLIWCATCWSALTSQHTHVPTSGRYAERLKLACQATGPRRSKFCVGCTLSCLQH